MSRSNSKIGANLGRAAADQRGGGVSEVKGPKNRPEIGRSLRHDENTDMANEARRR